MLFIDRYGKNHYCDKGGFIDRIGVFAFIRNLNGDVLLVRPKGSQVWELPGGGVEKGEWKDQALKRELYEETGIALADNIELSPKLGMVFNYYPDDVNEFRRYSLNLYVLEFKHQPYIKAGNEIENVAWMPDSVWDSLLVNYMHRELIRGYLSMKSVSMKATSYDDILGYI